ncbi:hypothetical protein ACS0TY_025198 [Phlomoides rotata]
MASRKRSMSNDSDVPPMYKEWDEALCPICMDHPHNGVLLICTSHHKSCRPYICDTSYRHSNCLDRFKKLNEENTDTISATNLIQGSHQDSTGPHDHGTNLEEQEGREWGTLDLSEMDIEKSEMSNLRCPLCRGRVLGWKVLEDARKYLNQKSRSCSRESCSFSGNYRELRSHARRVHPMERPADVDPSRERAWRRFQDEREYNDIVSSIRSAMPGAVIVGDYVFEGRDGGVGGGGGGGEGGWLSTLFFLQMFGSLEAGAELRGGRSRLLPRHRRASGTSSRRRSLWGENLFGQREGNNDEDDELDLNLSNDVGPSSPRRRRRLTRGESDEDQT